MKALQLLEHVLTTLGVAGVLLGAAAYVDSFAGSSRALAAFDDAVAAESVAPALAAPRVDQTLWSAGRKRDYADVNADVVPLAVLEIDRLHLQVPVFPGTDRVTLNRGAGIVEGTAYPGEGGNVVLSAHRDGFFRALKDIVVGDEIRLRTLQGDQSFVVKELFVTDPLDISVLAPTESSTLTLITCYPFYYVGFAPERFIVRALPAGADGAKPHAAVSMQIPASASGSAREAISGALPSRQPADPTHNYQVTRRVIP